MQMSSEHSFSLQELKRFDGDWEARMLIAYQGVVYDVTDCPKWRTGIHEGQHFPGQDLTDELEQNAPHSAGVLLHDCARRVGILVA
jgi:predicted heme/steroid binding protein